MDKSRRPTKLTLVRNPFTDVARIITKGAPPPDWIADGLEHFSGIIGPRPSIPGRAQFERIIEEMQEAAKTLVRYLPAFQRAESHLPSFQCPDEVTSVLAGLPKVIADIERLKGEPRTGRRPDVRRKFCAEVIVEIWKLLHGKAEPHSERLKEACNEYWRACGNAEIGDVGDLDNWRRAAKRAAGKDNAGTRVVLITVQNPP